MVKNSQITEQEEKIIAEVKSLPLLPRSAWNSQVTYLKVLLKAKQALDKNARNFRQ